MSMVVRMRISRVPHEAMRPTLVIHSPDPLGHSGTPTNTVAFAWCLALYPDHPFRSTSLHALAKHQRCTIVTHGRCTSNPPPNRHNRPRFAWPCLGLAWALGPPGLRAFGASLCLGFPVVLCFLGALGLPGDFSQGFGACALRLARGFKGLSWMKSL